MFRKTSHVAEQLHQMSWSKNRITTHFTDSVYLWRGGVKTCLRLLFGIMVWMTVTDMNAQNKTDFESKMQQHIQSFLLDNQKVEKWKKENTTPFIKLDPTENEDLLNNLVTELKHNFIIANMDEYKRAYFPEEFVASMVMTDTFICDNGGFESDFTYYKGYSSTFSSGSSTCNPISGGNPSVYVPTTLPTVREFEIVTSGTDAVTGLQKVKFGSKALKLNDVYHHSDAGCTGSEAINKIVKRFKVTEENLDFTVWYSIALEDPTGHVNTQPFFNIACDLAPLSDLCFDADILNCDKIYNQPGCGRVLMDVLDWSCHRIKIPKEEIGNIATLEIVMGDCGLGCHNGYAYIDGICEECTGSALGSVILYDTIVESGLGIVYRSCDGENATICGTITYPTLCNDWVLDSLVFPGIDLVNLDIDQINETFCFTLPLSAFGSEDCLEITGYAYFRSDTLLLPVQISNTIEVCREFYDGYEYNVYVGDCNDNNTPNLLSDDYYFVRVVLGNLAGESWSMLRRLDYPYHNENGLHTLQTGSGNTDIFLGPFLRQDGGWDLIIDLPGCVFTEHIDPPNCELDCDAFSDYSITNVICTNGNEWAFKLNVPSGPSGSYKISGSSISTQFENFGSIATVSNLSITKECLTITLTQIITSGGMQTEGCSVQLIVCPPKPCYDNQSCDLEVYVDDISCTTSPEYTFTLDVNTSQSGKIICYQTFDESGMSVSANNTGPSTTPPSGPFEGDIRLVVELCAGPTCGNCDNRCYKVLYIPQPNCDEWDDDKSEIRTVSKIEEHKIKVYPNPFDNNGFTIESSIDDSNFEIFDLRGALLTKGKISKGLNQINFTGKSGIYLLKCTEISGKMTQVKLIKH